MGAAHTATIGAIRTLATDVLEYQLELDVQERDLKWRPGQFISLTCGHDAEGKPRLRSYSIASPPGTGRLDLVLKLVSGGEGSEWFRGLRGGEVVNFTGPMGFFVLDLQHPGDQLFAATGTGIAPFLPMIRESLARDETGTVHLLWGLRDEGDLFWRDELRALVAASPRFRYAIHLTRPSPSWTGATGRITQPALDVAPTLHRPTFYLCGSGAMIRDLRDALVARGVDRKRQIRSEAFF